MGTSEPRRGDRQTRPETAQPQPPDPGWSDLRERARLQAAVVRLPVPQRDALMLWRFEGLGYEDIARVLGTTVQAAKVLLWRARESLRAAMASPLGMDGPSMPWRLSSASGASFESGS